MGSDMNIISYAVILLIISGAVIMAVNIFKFRTLFLDFQQFLALEYQKLRIFYKLHQGLMLFFLFGYIAVFFTIISKIEIVGELFVGVIFFFGAIFVLFGILLQSKMFTSIKGNFEKTVAMGEIIDRERERLFNVNEQLKQEMEERILLEKERKKVESQLVRAQKMEAIGILAGGVAHDLNNVLVGLVSYPELLLRDIPKDSQLRRNVLTIQKSGEKAAAIVKDLLTLARRGVSVSEVVNMNDIISEYLRSPEFEKLKQYHSNIEIKAIFDEELFNMVGSPVHLGKTIMNLVSNAAEAMPNGGVISITTENCILESRLRGYEEVEEGEYISIKVKDTGVGISRKDGLRIFEPFYTKKVMGLSGTGLGMAVVWNTVKDHKGYIDFQSTEGRGSTFALYFPITKEEKKDKAEEFSIEAIKGKGESILIADDVEEQRIIASSILEELGYSTSAVSSGEEAIEYLKQNPVDLLLLDMIMDPGMDGLDTYKKALEINPSQKAIIASGYSETDRIQIAKKMGLRKYIMKPYTLEEIGKAVRSELDREVS